MGGTTRLSKVSLGARSWIEASNLPENLATQQSTHLTPTEASSNYTKLCLQTRPPPEGLGAHLCGPRCDGGYLRGLKISVGKHGPQQLVALPSLPSLSCNPRHTASLAVQMPSIPMALGQTSDLLRSPMINSQSSYTLPCGRGTPRYRAVGQPQQDPHKSFNSIFCKRPPALALQ
ncbi:hypothetical protein THAOC_20431 [Thalassiosira oceanica]|uniref:Uncharacterized protein n=1 Tax=Thalassiosira oceanica TaxID=159749 RepID=K0S298_THAOC|nr:hypothetical protein THAOC_20431 [Thalassiosira oceanica]|eukprot:EJK59360.1 hypothetical protein THAOC_20431 [Thalassiosira oceanica]